MLKLNTEIVNCYTNSIYLQDQICDDNFHGLFDGHDPKLFSLLTSCCICWKALVSLIFNGKNQYH